MNKNNPITSYFTNHFARHENANSGVSLSGLNFYIAQQVTRQYWLDIYNEVNPEIMRAHNNAMMHIHDLGSLSAYCCGWDLLDILTRGFGGVHEKLESGPPRHLSVALWQIVNFMFTLQNEIAGACAISNFDTLLAPYIRHDNLSYDDLKQLMQEFLFHMNVSTRNGWQTPFTNITMDLVCPQHFKNQSVIIGGEYLDSTYGDYQHEMDMLNKAFCEVMIEGDAKGKPFIFPIPTYNITKDFDWINRDWLWEMTAQVGIPYFANFINSDMSPDDARSMCCRLRLDNRKLNRRMGGLFASAPLTGSVGVVTINLPHLACQCNLENDSIDGFFDGLENAMEIASQSLEVKRKVVEQLTDLSHKVEGLPQATQAIFNSMGDDRSLYPYARHWLEGVKESTGNYWGNHFSTIGLIGAYEAIMMLTGESIESSGGLKFAQDILMRMQEKAESLTERTGNLYNIEASPAEGASHRLAMIDSQQFNGIMTSGTKEQPYYTNSTQLPPGSELTPNEVMQNQDKVQTLYTGGTVLHLYLGEQITWQAARAIIKTAFEQYALPYMTITPTFSVCPEHGRMPGEHETCPTCGLQCDIYSRVVGYLRPVKNWNLGKQQNWKDRVKWERNNFMHEMHTNTIQPWERDVWEAIEDSTERLDDLARTCVYNMIREHFMMPPGLCEHVAIELNNQLIALRDDPPTITSKMIERAVAGFYEEYEQIY